MGSRSVSMTTGASGVKHLEMVILSAFYPFDPDGTSYVQHSLFWDVSSSCYFAYSTSSVFC